MIDPVAGCSEHRAEASDFNEVSNFFAILATIALSIDLLHGIGLTL
jgi:hypothetical protein